MRNMAVHPRVTYALIAINVVAFLATGRFSAVGSAGGDAVYSEGALLGSFAGEGVAYGQWWRIVTGGFLHANFLHIFFNMYILYLVGVMLEPAIGHVKFALVYFVSLLAGSFGALLLTPHAFTVGASGAVFGLMGAAAVEMRARRIPVMQSGIGILIVLNLALSFAVSGISIGGHIGGLIGGALAAVILQLGERHRSQAVAIAGCVALGVACFAGSIGVSQASKAEAPAAVPGQFVVPE
jgi:membrane associated rhomboid family serine protease